LRESIAAGRIEDFVAEFHRLQAKAE